MSEAHHNITIKDIARKFKCSPSTVSRALNNNPLISIETRNTLQEYAKKMGYEKNTISLSLLQQSTKTIGVIIPSISHSHETLMINGIQSVINDHGYMLNFGITNEKMQLEKEHVKRFYANRVDAIIASVAFETSMAGDYSHFEHIQNKNIPLIFIDREIPLNNSYSFTVDDYEGAYLATQHLIDIGKKKIAFIKGPEGLKVSAMRLSGYLECLKHNNIEVNYSYIKKADFDIKSARKPTTELFNRSNQEVPDALFCSNDYLSFGAMKVLKEFGYNIPEDVAVIGFDNCPISEYFQPSLSSIERKSFSLGEQAASLLTSQLSKTDSIHKNFKSFLKPDLIVRDSTFQKK